MILENTLFFAHIPKTAGTSFRKELENALGSDSVFYDYGSKSSETHPIVLEHLYKQHDPYALTASELNQNHHTLIGGHVHVNKYGPLVQAQNIISFVREPLQQVVSHFEHFKRKFGYNRTITEFCQEKRFKNTQSRVLGGYPLESIGFIGLTEAYSDSLEIINQLFDMNLKERSLNGNQQKTNLKYEVDSRIQALIEAENQDDLQLYKNVKNLFEKRRAWNQKTNMPYTHSHIAKHQNNALIGWCFQANQNQPIEIQALDNNENVLKHYLNTHYRPGLKNLNAPRDGFIGLHIAPGEAKAIKSLKVKETNQILWESRS